MSPGLPWGALLGVGFWVLGLPADAVPLQVHVQLRPHVQHFLESLSKTYEVPGAPQNSPGGLRGARQVVPHRGGEGSGSSHRSLHLLSPDLHLHNGEAGLRREGPGCAGPQKEADQVMSLQKPCWGGTPVAGGCSPRVPRHPAGAASPSGTASAPAAATGRIWPCWAGTWPRRWPWTTPSRASPPRYPLALVSGGSLAPWPRWLPHG